MFQRISHAKSAIAGTWRDVKTKVGESRLVSDFQALKSRAKDGLTRMRFPQDLHVQNGADANYSRNKFDHLLLDVDRLAEALQWSTDTGKFHGESNEVHAARIESAKELICVHGWDGLGAKDQLTRVHQQLSQPLVDAADCITDPTAQAAAKALNKRWLPVLDGAAKDGDLLKYRTTLADMLEERKDGCSTPEDASQDSFFSSEASSRSVSDESLPVPHPNADLVDMVTACIDSIKLERQAKLQLRDLKYAVKKLDGERGTKFYAMLNSEWNSLMDASEDGSKTAIKALETWRDMLKN